MESTSSTQHLVVVGGGTAGWLSALVIQAEARSQDLPLKITLIESSKVPTVGVGEGSTSVLRGLLQSLGVDEEDFLAKTDATIKYGIRHRDWRRLGHVYDGPIDDAYALADRIPGVGSWLDTYAVAAGKPVADMHIFRWLMERRRAPVAERSGARMPVSAFHHAYHFDQSKVGAYLRVQAHGITTFDALVTAAERDSESGDITSLLLDDGQRVAADFVIDCTGFRRALIAGEMGAGWVSYEDALPVNRAMPFWLDLKAGQELPPYTHAWAQKAGWMWQIPTFGRIGCGYVYSDRHIGPDEAKAEIEQVLGQEIEPRNDIRINAGRLSEVWRGNCLAVGLSSSFIEPLEATSIHGTVVQLLLFARRHLARLDATTPAARQRFNAAIAGQVDDFRDFINLHYVSARDDTVFWRDVRQDFIQPGTRDRVARWQCKMPGPEDFRNDLDGLPHVEELLHYPVLDGLGLLSREVAKADMARDPQLRAFARKTHDHLLRQGRAAAGKALKHRDYLNSLRPAKTERIQAASA